MSDITSIERIQLERLFQLEDGYVLDFSNATFEAFVLENFGIEIYSEKYEYNSGSKANRLRAFWKFELNYLAGDIIHKMIEYGFAKNLFSKDEDSKQLIDACNKIGERLKQDSPVENIEAIKATNNDKDFSLLAKTIRESIEKNEPETALDRLHTFVIKYVRELCDKYSIGYDKDTALHSLFGGYVKHLQQEKILESEMTVRILKSSISVMEAFNHVRNNQSFAHDNPILNYNESILILNDISNVIRFIEAVERPSIKAEKETEEIDIDDLPF
ncbi:hypothetical protein GCM10011506_42150 [Marivirga lumbricoides]|uniref:Abortive infection protein-like C-terminal domain-containing protein n=1 Tax=Marivirga lumbricoides TaxID=1046115 RepID=A0ABQ1N3G3_9BACT|nr:hypothetical protein GCM10011506_42150 [Marivirga lumbricoides]